MKNISAAAVSAFTQFIVRRHQVYEKRASGASAPWTNDPILQQYRFCNVYRELDRVTLWVRQNYSNGHEDQWFSMAAARMINDIETMRKLPLPTPWRASAVLDVLNKRAESGLRVFGPAYIISTNGMSMPKPKYVVEEVLNPMWADRKRVRPRKGDTLAEFHERLMRYNGMGSFMAAQVVADTKNSQKDPLRAAPDWWTWAAPGPGSIRGLARIVNGDHEQPVPKKEWLDYVNVIRDAVNRELVARGWEQVCAQDLQNCLCEFDKYERVRLGQGRPKQMFTPHETQPVQHQLV